jgi:hypothetical protein
MYFIGEDDKPILSRMVNKNHKCGIQLEDTYYIREEEE